MKQQLFAAPMSAAQRELERVKIVYEEDEILRRARTSAKERFHETRMFEQTVELKNKIKNLRDNEIATLNILEDTRELEEKLESERNRLALIISSMDEGLLLIDKNNYEVVLMNSAAEKIWGVSSTEVIGKNINTVAVIFKGDKIIPEEERPVAKMFQTSQAIAVGLEDNFYCQDISGRKFPVALTVSPIKGGGVIGAVVVFRDITPEKNLNEARTSFVSVASHQLRTPLTAIQWNLELLMSKETGTLTDMQKKFTADAYEETEKLIETINVLLSLARAESGSINIEPTPVAVVDFIRAIAKELAPLCAKKEIALTVREPEHSVPPIILDAPMLREVIMNIFSNAIRYSNPHGTVEVIFEIEDNAVTVLVKDNGIGIPSSQHSRVFEKFFRADNAVRKITEGTGLGLNLAKTLVTLWHGKIWFTSEEGKGTTFYFTIPYAGMKEKREGKPIAV